MEWVLLIAQQVKTNINFDKFWLQQSLQDPYPTNTDNLGARGTVGGR